MRALDWLKDEGRAVGRALVRAPAVAYHWLADNASRCLAVLWLGGMLFVVGVMVKRIVRVEGEEGAVAGTTGAAAPTAVNGGGPEQVVQMMDVDEINGITDQRMHALGLSAAGDLADPDQAAIDAARAARGTSEAAAGQVTGGAGGVVVVSKGGIAGWIKRNKGKRADPETLAWLRGEEKAEGRAAYAGWTDSGDGDLMSWLVKNKGKPTGPTNPDTQQAIAEVSAGSAGIGAIIATGSGGQISAGPAGSDAPSAVLAGGSGELLAGSGHTSSRAPTASGPPDAQIANRPPPPAPRPLDLASLGTAAVFALAPSVAAQQRQSLLVTLRTRLAATPALTAQLHNRQILIRLPIADLFASPTATDLSPAGAATIRRLGALVAALHTRDVEVRGDADRALELASALVVGGVDPDRLALAATDPGAASDGSDAAPRALALILLETP